MTIFKTVVKLAIAILCLAIPALAHADALLTPDGNFAAPDSAFYSNMDIAAYTEVMNPSSTTSLTLFPVDPASADYERAVGNAMASSAWTAADSDLYPSWVPIYSGLWPSDEFGLTPEPPTLVLTALGLLGLAVAGNRRRVLARTEAQSK